MVIAAKRIFLGCVVAVLFGGAAHAQPYYGSPHWAYDGRYHRHYYYPAVGYAVPVLPPGNIAVAFGGGRLYFHAGVWFRAAGPSYVVIRPPVGVVIPALDEERAIGRVIADIPAWVDRIVVADNGSVDRTIHVARAAGAITVEEPERGYGAACQAGIRALGGVDIVVFVDGDYADDPAEMAALVDPIAAGGVDLVIGARTGARIQKGSLTPQQRFGNWLACRLMRAIWGAQFTDLGPFRAIRRTALEGLAMRDRNYGWTVEMQIKAAQVGLPACEVEVAYRPRIGVSKVSGTVKGTVLAGYTILRVIGMAAVRRG